MITQLDTNSNLIICGLINILETEILILTVIMLKSLAGPFLTKTVLRRFK